MNQNCEAWEHFNVFLLGMALFVSLYGTVEQWDIILNVTMLQKSMSLILSCLIRAFHSKSCFLVHKSTL